MEISSGAPWPPVLLKSGTPRQSSPTNGFLKLDDDAVESLPKSSLEWMRGMEAEGKEWPWVELSSPSASRNNKNPRLSSSTPGKASASDLFRRGFSELLELEEEVLGLELLEEATNEQYAYVLKKCGDLRAIDLGRRVHHRLSRRRLIGERFLANCVMQMYSKCRSLEEAKEVFEGIHRRNRVSWNIILSAYVQSGLTSEALLLFRRMPQEYVQPDKFTYSTMISACTANAAFADGIWIHQMIADAGLDTQAVVGASLIIMYGKCHSLEIARSVFERIVEKDVVVWNSMMSVYAQDGSGREALRVYQRMQLEGVKAGAATFLSVLEACTGLASLALGRMIHSNLVAGGFESDLLVATALVKMYSKCGKVVEAREVFDRMKHPDVVAWTAMVAAYAQHGYLDQSKSLMRSMELEGMSANSVTFLTLLFACSHSGLLYFAQEIFVSMSEHHGVSPSREHFRCLVDLLGRGGRLLEAQELLLSMPFEPGITAWLTMLSACRLQGDLELAEFAAERCYALEPGRTSAYILMSNMYAAVGRWDDVERIRRLMEARGVRKEPGMSCIEVKNRLHEFFSGDKCHPERDSIYREVKRLSEKLVEAGYVPDTSLVLHNVDEETKRLMLSTHSERLALAFGLLNTTPGASLCIVNNMRVCSDCHAVFKLVSGFTGRQISVRDTKRFHSFWNGKCSCGDYW